VQRKKRKRGEKKSRRGKGEKEEKRKSGRGKGEKEVGERRPEIREKMRIEKGQIESKRSGARQRIKGDGCHTSKKDHEVFRNYNSCFDTFRLQKELFRAGVRHSGLYLGEDRIPEESAKR